MTSVYTQCVLASVEEPEPELIFLNGAQLLDLFRLLLFGKKTVFTATVAIDFYKNSGAEILDDWRVAQMDEKAISYFVDNKLK